MLRRLRTLTEVECYLRCYGTPDPPFRRVRLLPPRRRTVRLSGEHVRRGFQIRLDARDVEAA